MQPEYSWRAMCKVTMTGCWFSLASSDRNKTLHLTEKVNIERSLLGRSPTHQIICWWQGLPVVRYPVGLGVFISCRGGGTFLALQFTQDPLGLRQPVLLCCFLKYNAKVIIKSVLTLKDGLIPRRSFGFKFLCVCVCVWTIFKVFIEFITTSVLCFGFLAIRHVGI